MQWLLLFVLVLQSGSGDPFGNLRREWAQDLHEKRVDASVALYAPDATFIKQDGSRVHGTAALRDLYRMITSSFDSDLTFASQRVENSGNLAYDSGTYKETLVTRASGRTQHMSGSYLTVYRREKDRWVIVEQVWTGGEEKTSQAQ